MTDDHDEPVPLVESVRRLLAAVPDAAAGPDPDHQREIDRLLHEWQRRIPRRFEHATLGDFDDAVANAIRAWASAARPANLLILGPVGVGKTHAAVGTLRLAHEQGLTVIFAPIVEALDWLRPGGPPDVTQRLGSCAVLCLDDLGAERPTDWTAERLYGIVNRRWLNELPTVVTTNLDPTALEKALDPRLYSRLVHNATGVNIGGRDRRRRG